MTSSDNGRGSTRDFQLPLRPLIFLSATAFATVTAELMPASLLLELSRDLEVSRAQAGLVVAAWALTVAATSLPMVRVTRRIKQQVLVPSILLVLSLATLVTASAPTFEVAVAGRVAAAVAHGLFWSLLVPIAAALVPPEKAGRAISVVLAGPSVAGIVGIPLGAAVGSALGWRVSFGALALLLLAAAGVAALLRLPDATRPGQDRAPQASGYRSVVLLSSAGGLILTGHFALYTFVSPLLEDLGHFGSRSRAALLLVFGAAGVVGTLLAGSISDRHPTHAFTWVAVAFALSAFSLRLVAQSTPAAVAAITAWGLLMGLLPPVFQTRLLRSAPPGRETTVSALGITVLNLGIAAGAGMGGVTVAVAGPGALPYAAAAVIGATAAGLIVSAAPMREAPARR
ncbi:MFS transporter [Nocardioides sp. zg-1228]|uniref:MFS transporter n=1 Tax=Nocardioides sp. zg-1228 TaxID=2763008 RepID=UPI0016435A87|nr:MFS transporter [Nocardioides sp. zg-1228]MBC2934646.1 MFS transporter [Nocardioides sp. zg-1228]QSF59391.1 MFS transporter [Nocardioides sp. zg-1228]